MVPKIFFRPQQWTLGFYIAVAAALLAVNLFGPRGLLQWVLLEQKKGRLLAEEKNIQNEIQALESDLSEFDRSSHVKQRAIRDILGYLKVEEGSVELIVENEGNVRGPSLRKLDVKNDAGLLR